jgi:hypothetical protein
MASARITLEQLVSLAAGELTSAEASHLEALAGADATTAAELQRLRTIIDTLQSSTTLPADVVVNRVKDWMTTLPVTADHTQDLVAELLFDSQAGPLAGYRGALAERHLMFKAGDAELDIQMTSEPDNEGQWEIVGQLDAQGPTIPAMVELLAIDGGEAIARTMIGLHGSFTLRASAGNYSLKISWPSGRIVIDRFDVP